MHPEFLVVGALELPQQSPVCGKSYGALLPFFPALYSECNVKRIVDRAPAAGRDLKRPGDKKIYGAEGERGLLKVIPDLPDLRQRELACLMVAPQRVPKFCIDKGGCHEECLLIPSGVENP